MGCRYSGCLFNVHGSGKISKLEIIALLHSIGLSFRDEIGMVAEAFHAFDRDNNGYISTAQLVRSMVSLQVAGGMVYAHKAKLFHPDKNPMNLNVGLKFQSHALGEGQASTQWFSVM